MIRFPLRQLLWLAGGLFLTSTVVAVRPIAPNVAVATTTVHSAPQDDTNPTVAPGLVKWHPTFAEAQAAARQSGKPVLLFHMMGGAVHGLQSQGRGWTQFVVTRVWSVR